MEGQPIREIELEQPIREKEVDQERNDSEAVSSIADDNQQTVDKI